MGLGVPTSESQREWESKREGIKGLPMKQNLFIIITLRSIPLGGFEITPIYQATPT
jgi:hypothetical protein